MPIDWNEIKTWVKDTTKIALKEAEDLSIKGKLKMEIFSLSHERDRLFLNLGKFIYTEYSNSKKVELNEKILETINKIHKTEEKIKETKEEF